MTAARTKDNGNGERQRETAAEFRGYVRATLEAISKDVVEIKTGMAAVCERLNQAEVDIGGLKVKAGIWGGLAGLIGGAVIVAGFLVSLALLFWKGWLS